MQPLYFGSGGPNAASILQLSAHQAMQSWRRTDLAVGTSSLTALTAVQQSIAIGAAQDRQQSILASGAASGGTLLSLSMLNDASSPANIVNYGATGTVTCAPASDNNGVIFFATSAGVFQSSNGGASASAVTVTGLTGAVSWVGFTGSHYLVFESPTKKLFTATALGGTWNNQVLPVGSVFDLLTNGAGTWVLSCNHSGQPTALQSTSDGVAASWSSGTALGSGSCGAAGSPDGFVVLGSDGHLWGSGDGLTWRLNKTVSALAGLSLGSNSVASSSGVIAVVSNRGTNGISKAANGIAYSLDGGATWFETYITSPLGSNPITNLIAANGRFYAIDGVAIFQSGQIMSPNPLFLGI